MNRLKAVLFDVDGVLVHSQGANEEFFASLIEAGGYSRPDQEAIRRCFHLPMRGTIEQLIGAEDPAEVDRIWEIGNGPHRYPTELLEFPDELLPVLGGLKQSYRLGIVTSRVKKGVDALYAAADIAGFFDIAVAFEDYSRPKPHPEPLQVALARLCLGPSETVYIGDSNTDIESANAAGMPSIHLSPTKHPDATLGITHFSQIPAAVVVIANG